MNFCWTSPSLYLRQIANSSTTQTLVACTPHCLANWPIPWLTLLPQWYPWTNLFYMVVLPTLLATTYHYRLVTKLHFLFKATRTNVLIVHIFLREIYSFRIVRDMDTSTPRFNVSISYSVMASMFLMKWNWFTPEKYHTKSFKLLYVWWIWKSDAIPHCSLLLLQGLLWCLRS